MKIMLSNKHLIPFFIDDEDEEIVSNYFWYITPNSYPSTKIKDYYNGICTGWRSIKLHQILGGFAPEGLE